ncbi:glycosyltransferase family 4 protein [Chloroflexota bacterium]
MDSVQHMMGTPTKATGGVELKKIKLLGFMDDPQVHSGFGEVSRAILAYLHSTGKYDIHICALNWNGDEHDKEEFPYRYYHVTTDLRGLERTGNMIEKVEPDCVFILNDPDWLYEYFKRNPLLLEVPTVVYSPIDGYPFPVWWLTPFRQATKSIVYTQWARECIRKKDPNIDVEVVPHGHSPAEFYPGPKERARQLLGLNPNWFIVLRSDRNTERKDWGATFEAFAKFAEDKPEARLYAHCVWQGEHLGWVIPDLIEMFGLSERVINTKGFADMRTTVPVQVLNLIMNSADVFLSTTKGEGWGLNIHHARACGVPVIAPDNSAVPEVVGDGGELISIARRFVEPNGVVNDLCDIDHAVEILEKLYRSPKLREKYRQRSLLWARKMTWNLIVPEFDRIIKEAILKFRFSGYTEVKRWEYIQVDG